MESARRAEVAPDRGEVEELKPYFREPKRACPSRARRARLHRRARFDDPAARLRVRFRRRFGGSSFFAWASLIHRLLELLPEQASRGAGRFG